MNHENHKGKVALVTGAAQGLGKTIALRMAEDGADLVVFDTKSDGELVADEIKSQGRKALFFQLDISDEEAVGAAVLEIEKKIGPVKILVNNAAITDNISTLLVMSRQAWDKEIKVNLTGTFNCIKAVLNGMIESEWGRIINISSMTAVMGAYGRCAYAASKAGLIGLTKTVALEYVRYGVTANVILPGVIKTPATDALPEDIRQKMEKRIPGRQFGIPEDVAYCVSFLASEKSKYINGTEINISGGLELFTF